MLGSEESLRYLRDRFGFYYGAAVGIFMILFLRLFYLQIVRGSEFKQYSEENHIRKEKIPAPRGMIFDRNGVPLVDNVPTFDVTITPQFMNNATETIATLAHLLQIPVNDINTVLSKNKTLPSFHPRVVEEDVSRDIVGLISHRKLDLPGVEIEMRIKRLSRVKEVGAQMLGYVGEVSKDELGDLSAQGLGDYMSGDTIGKDGLENQLEQTLRGKDGKRFVQVDARGRRKNISQRSDPYDFYQELEPQPGKNVTLTIDQDLQDAAYTAFGDKIGGAVVMDVHSGAVLAMVSRPSYDPTVLSLGLDRNYFSQVRDNPFHAFGNKVIHSHQPPGSTFKVVTAIAGLEEKVITKDTKFFCGGQKRFGRRLLHCHSKGGHGDMDLHHAIVKSCNIYFYNVASRLSIDRLAYYAFMLGLGKRTNIPLKREIAGLVPTSEWKVQKYGEPWQDGETLSVGIGQGFVLLTPLQEAVMYGAIANGGHLLRPYLVKEVTSPFNGEVLQREGAPEAQPAQISEGTLAIIRSALAGVVNEPGGTMYWRRLPGDLMAGKTGTSQVRKLSNDEIYGECETLPFKERRHAWFVGYAPAKDPEISFAVLAEHACHGNSGAGAIAREIVKAYFDKKARLAGQAPQADVKLPTAAEVKADD